MTKEEKNSNRLAVIARNYLHKGAKVYMEGKIANREWQDQEDKAQYTIEIVA